AQMLYETWWPWNTASVACSSSIRCSFAPGQGSVESLHEVAAFQQNTPCKLGVSVNLTDWLPARATDTVNVSLKYHVMWRSPISNLMECLAKNDRVSKVSLLKPELTAALKVSVIAGKLLSCLVGEGKKCEPFALSADLTVATLQAGFHAVVGSNVEQKWP